MVDPYIQDVINELVIEKLQLAYFIVGEHGRIEFCSDNLVCFGFAGVVPGLDVTDVLDFMVGINLTEDLDMPMMQSPSGDIVSLNFLCRNNRMIVLVSDANEQAEQRQKLQQTANENELLLDTQKKLMDELSEASRLQTQFLSGVSHEFRTPLTSILGYTGRVEDGLNRDEVIDVGEVQGYVQQLKAVTRSSNHLLSLVENLLDHGKLGSGEIVIQPKSVLLREPFQDVELLLEPLSNAKKISLDMSYEFDTDLCVYIDDSRLRQCLINLLGNAIKFTDEGEVTLSASWQDDLLFVSIRDTGLGISDDDLKKIRLPFWQAPNTGKAGTGLGLTITENLIELMGGSLDVGSTLGKGTCIKFELVAAEIDAELKVTSSPSVDDDSALNVLFAEDDRDIADLIYMMLVEKGVQVTHVENGAKAVNAISHDSFDLVLMDINMPVMTGYQALEKIRSSGDKTPVIFMSASGLDSDRAKAEKLGGDGYLVKPVAVDDIIELAKQLVER